MTRRHLPNVVIPRALYRLQLSHDFTFHQAAEWVAYLDALGVSHCNLSPYLKARPGSTHGYDIVDHGSLNPELGGARGFDALTAALRRHGMGQVLDLVANHMGIGGHDNPWWLDVLENGEASRYADYFDIDWLPQKAELRSRLLAPFLGDHYGAVLENGELRLEFQAARGSFWVRYFRHRFPIDPKTYPFILHHQLEAQADELRLEAIGYAEFRTLAQALGELPGYWESEPVSVAARRANSASCKQRLAGLCRRFSPLAVLIAHNVTAFNGKKGDAGSFDRLHRLLEMQPYRLAYWKVAAQEINYRRFFDVNELAAIRVEKPEVFQAVHRLVSALIRRGKVDGVRIDHPDGLFDPARYFHRLQGGGAEAGSAVPPAKNCYIVVEKILAGDERLPEHWPVHGTTGYEFANAVNGLFVMKEGERFLDRIYRRFTGERRDFEEILHDAKKLIMQTALSSELNVLAGRLDRLSEADRHSRDFTLNGLRAALREIVAYFPVYRTYLTAAGGSEDDRRHVARAIAEAKRRNPALEEGIFDFIHRVLCLDFGAAPADAVQFTMKFQQYTGPVMAKGMEDTAFYRYHRLVSLNEVGGNPAVFGITVDAFHQQNLERAARWPHAMLNTSTHDTKRSEDARARINILSELPQEWGRHVAVWSRLNRRHRTGRGADSLPSRGAEYLFYQTLLGAWPLEEMDARGLVDFRERIEAAMVKSAREAKTHSSWIRVNRDYETALRRFIRGVLADNRFLDHFSPLQRKVSHLGMLNSLSQTLLKLTAPGVPQIYQGNELWDFSLVDPDNRRRVDYARRRALLATVKVMAAQEDGRTAARLLNTWTDGRIKLYLTWRVLTARKENAALFRDGDYHPLTATGARADCLCAFARTRGSAAAVTLAPRRVAVLAAEADNAPLRADLWQDTQLMLPARLAGRWRNLLTGETLETQSADGCHSLALARALASFPYGLWLSVGD